jgi:hypothetical protein
MGGAEKVIISITEMMVVPLLAPILLGLLSKRVNVGALWTTAGICIPLGLALHFGWFAPDTTSGLGKWLKDQSMTIVGVVLPMLILAVFHFRSRGVDRHWKNIEQLKTREQEFVDSRPTAQADHSPARIVAWSMVALGAGMACLIPINPGDRAIILVFALVLAGIGGLMFWGTKKSSH